MGLEGRWRGGGGVAGALQLARHREEGGGGKAEWSTFPVHKVNVSSSRVVKDAKGRMTRVTSEEAFV